MREGRTPWCEYGSEGNRRGGDRTELRYDRGENEPPSVAVVTALAEYHGEDVTETDHLLYEYVDPEALDALFANRNNGESRRPGCVQFDVADAHVVVTADRISVSATE